MAVLLAVLFIVGVWEATKYAGEHARGDYRRSRDAKVREAGGASLGGRRRRSVIRRHRAGYWAGEVAHGFPVTRTGLHTGWQAHRTASAHEKHKREEARTTTLETLATLLPSLREHRERQEKARREIEEQQAREREVQGSSDPAPLPSETVGQPTRRVDGNGPEPPADDRTADDIAAWEEASSADSLAGWLEASKPDPRLNDAQRERDASGQRNICAACGHPGTPDDRLVVTEDGYRVHGSHTADPADGYYGQEAAGEGGTNGNGTQPPATEGGHMPTGTAADTTYDQLQAEATKVVQEAEQQVASLQASRLPNLVEGMAGMVNDSNSLSRAAEIDEAIRAQIKATQQVLDAAQNFKDGLRRDHGGMNAAHQDAPVKGAQPEFYEG